MNQEKEVISSPLNTDLLLHPVLLLYVDFPTLFQLSGVNKQFRKLYEDENTALGFWPAICNSFCSMIGLYSPVVIAPDAILSRFNYRRHFVDDLWSLRYKWNSKERDAMAFKVRVSCRFRPGDPPGGRVCLPLHQFLRLRRQQKNVTDKENSTNVSNSSSIFAGAKDPEEFCDPLLGSLMREPVLLLTSNRVVDRTVAVQCISRGGRDPFNGKRLTVQQLVPQPELALRIQEWRSRPERTDISVDVRDAKALVDDTEVQQEFLEALLEVEQMQSLVKKAAWQDMQRHRRPFVHAAGDPAAVAVEGDNGEAPEINPDVTVGLIDDEMDQIPGPFSLQGLMQHGDDRLVHDTSSSQQLDHQGKQVETARMVEMNDDKAFVSMHVPGTGVRAFHFSNVFAKCDLQEDIYTRTSKDSVEAVLNGCNACVLCYGQTGSGKTFSFLGPEGALDAEEQHQLTQSDLSRSTVDLLPQSGILLRAAAEFFQARELLMRRSNHTIAVGVKVQVVEVYEEKVTDLMTGRPVSVSRETGTVANGSEHSCETLLDFFDLYRVAHGRQRFAETAMNDRSSRAHTLVIFHVTQQQTQSKDAVSDGSLVTSQMYLVDLAGSERVKKSRVTGQRLREAVGINSSLLVLGKVISALVDGNSHVPYLESKLTTLLKAAFGGNARTMVLLNARTETEHSDETLQTLRFGERCGMISNTLKQRASSLEATMQTLDDALETMRSQLEGLQRRGKEHLDSYRALQQSFQQLQRKRAELLALHARSSKQRAGSESISASTTSASAE